MARMRISDAMNDNPFPELDMQDYRADKAKTDAYNYYANGGNQQRKPDRPVEVEEEKQAVRVASPEEIRDAKAAAIAMAKEFKN